MLQEVVSRHSEAAVTSVGRVATKPLTVQSASNVKQKKKEQEERVNAAYVEEDMVDEETISL